MEMTWGYTGGVQQITKVRTQNCTPNLGSVCVPQGKDVVWDVPQVTRPGNFATARVATAESTTWGQLKTDSRSQCLQVLMIVRAGLQAVHSLCKPLVNFEETEKALTRSVNLFGDHSINSDHTHLLSEGHSV
ncbi:hypothetical protein OG455_21390 [Kitasatospora sp. NBC_01287]|uniref:hypothetical protein n=1 Tax=Kitasatospora sp. NBC_01287 TaxID=2903573 RepID=UPI0022552A6F|nr:hypothetical protein [Kitasatospora sp. NBC_01287]MCX4748038.1 hypothetical protein [Kitasatospora sp. NBC_01287]